MLATLLLALSLSTDAFAAALAKGARFPALSLRRQATIALNFGLLEGLMPLLGYLLGLQFEKLIEETDHWVAFGLLGAIGAHMLWRSFHPHEEGARPARPSAPTARQVALTALGTSVDATIIGVTLAFLPQQNAGHIPATFATIGVATFVMVMLGLRIGKKVGPALGTWAERLGGLLLMALGTHILLSHLLA